MAARSFQAHCVTVRDPFHPMGSREIRTLECSGPISALAPKTTQPFIILQNGQAVLRRDWDQPVSDGDLMAVVLLPQGGGGGSNPLKAILMIAVAVFAPWATTQIGTLGGVALTTGAGGLTMAGSIVAGAIGLVGNMLINALIPPPKASTANTGASYASSSPTYSLSAQGNTARIEEAIPIQYGRMQSFPDFAAAPYVEYKGNEQYLYQLFCIGVGEYEIESIRVEDTPIANFEEITYEIVGPGETLDLFPASVITSIEVSGQEAETGVTLGGFVANPAGTLTTRLAFDVVTPRGLYYANDDGGLDKKTVTFRFQARAINDSGAAIGSWVTLGTRSITAGTTTPQRMSYDFTVAAGRYEATMLRTDTKDTSSRAGHELAWAGLRAYMPETRDFGNVTLLAMRLRATNNLSSQASRKINVIATRKLATWDGSTWSTSATPTRSIAWALANACRTIGLTDAQYGLAELRALDTTWASRGDTIDCRFDQTGTFWDALTKIAQTGRAKPYMQGGIIHFVRDQPSALPAAMYSMRNIVRGSFNLEFITPTQDTADAVVVSYFDETTWKYRTVKSKLPDSTAAKPAKVDLFGVTQREQANREGLYMAAANRYRRTMICFQTEMEGFLPSYGDLISISHDLPQWGQAGELVAWDAATLTATLSEPLTWESGQTHYIGLRRRNGTLSGPYSVTAGTDEHHVVLVAEPDFVPYTGGAEERTHFTFGWGDTWRQLARVVSIKPKDEYRVEIAAINEDPSVHTADTGAIAAPIVSSQLPSRFTSPEVLGLTARSMSGSPDKMILSWQPAPGADYYLIEQSSDGDTWTRCGEPSTANFSCTAIYGASTIVRVAAVGLTRGKWIQVAYGQLADYMWTNDSAPMWSSDTALMWKY